MGGGTKRADGWVAGSGEAFMAWGADVAGHGPGKKRGRGDEGKRGRGEEDGEGVNTLINAVLTLSVQHKPHRRRAEQFGV